jgi:mannose-6-phosphate isomerase
MFYPIKFKEIFKERVWGGSTLQSIVCKNIATNNIGESWEIVDREQDQSVVDNGNLSGKTIKYLRERYSNDFFGTSIDCNKPFPILVKILDANADLSLQVHPLFADKIMDAEPKSEFWYILEHKPDSYIMAGLNNFANLPEQEFKKDFIKNLESEKISGFVKKYLVKKHSLYYIDSGTLHAIGAGNLILEIQQNSDTTYRVSDWGRLENGKPRALHIKDSIENMDFNNIKNIDVKNVDLNKDEELINNNLFVTNSYLLNKEKEIVTTKKSCEIISITNGSVIIYNDVASLELSFGNNCLLPANTKYKIKPLTTSANYLSTRVG